jgi:hypothetical protein
MQAADAQTLPLIGAEGEVFGRIVHEARPNRMGLLGVLGGDVQPHHYEFAIERGEGRRADDDAHAIVR